MIESPTITASLAEQLDKPEFSYRVDLKEDDEMIWIQEEQDGTVTVHTTEPETSGFQRGLTAVVRWLPVEWML